MEGRLISVFVSALIGTAWDTEALHKLSQIDFFCAGF